MAPQPSIMYKNIVHRFKCYKCGTPIDDMVVYLITIMQFIMKEYGIVWAIRA